jgi:hypothetical protein
MFSKLYDSDPLPFTLKKEQYNNGINNYIPIYEHPSLEDKYTELSELIHFVALDDERSQIAVSGNKKINYFPSRKVRLTVDAKKCVENGIVPREMADKIVPYIDWEIKQNALYKNDLAVLDFIATINWERAIYTANPSSLNNILGIDQYWHQEGMVYKFMPVKADNYYQGLGGVNPDKTYEIFTNCRWGNLNDPGVTVDRESNRNSRLPRQNYLRAAETFLSRGEKAKAIELLDVCQKFFPDNKIPYDLMMVPFADIYYNAGEIEKGNAIVSRLIAIYADDLRYYKTVNAGFVQDHYTDDIDRNMRIMRSLSQMAKENGQNDLAAKADDAVAAYKGN